MKAMFVISLFTMVPLTSLQSFAGGGQVGSAGGGKISAISCKGYVSFENGTMEGNGEVRIERRTDGRWIMNNFIDAGENLSEDSSRLRLDTYSSFLSCSGATVEYNFERKEMTFRYKYGSGILGGGCQKTAATFTDCREEK